MKNQTIHSLASLLLVTLVASGCMTIDGRSKDRFDAGVFEDLADDLLRSLRPPVKVAVRPLYFEEVVISKELSIRFDSALVHALRKKGDHRFQIIARDDLQAVWNEADEFYDTRIEDLLKEAGAEVVVIGRATPVHGGLELSYKAYDLRSGRRGRLVASTELRFLSLNLQATEAMPLNAAVRGAANNLIFQLKSVDGFEPSDARLQVMGERSAFGDYILEILIEELEKRIAKLLRRGWQPLTGGKGINNQLGKVYGVASTVWDNRDMVMITFVIEDPDGRVVSRQSMRINSTSIPDGFLPLTSSGGRVTSKVYEARGEALQGAHFDGRAALRAARSLARARIVAQALGIPPPQISAIRDIADAASMFPYFSKGIPHMERWLEETTIGESRIQVRLRARVKRINQSRSGRIKAQLSSRVVQGGDPISLVISSSRRTTLGIFVWQADDRVIRVYPRDEQQQLYVKAGETLRLPRQGDAPFTSFPRPGVRSDYEVFILVANAVSLDYGRLAPQLGTEVTDTMSRSVPASEFFDGLAGEASEDTTVVFLPYEVRR